MNEIKRESKWVAFRRQLMRTFGDPTLATAQQRQIAEDCFMAGVSFGSRRTVRELEAGVTPMEAYHRLRAIDARGLKRMENRE